MSKPPDRYRNAVVAHIYVDGAAAAIAFYQKAFGAQELFRVAGKNGKIVHGEIAICGSLIMIGDPSGGLYGEPRKLGGCTAGLHVMVDDNEALLRRATAAGAEEIQPVTNMFYGASAGSVRDPFGHVWVLLSWKEDPDAAEIERRGVGLITQSASRYDPSHQKLGRVPRTVPNAAKNIEKSRQGHSACRS